MTSFATILNPSLTDHEGHAKFLSRLFTGGVATALNANSLKVTQRGAGSNQSVDVAVGDAHLVIPTSVRSYWGWTDAITNVPLTAANVTNPRYDTIVAWVDTTVTTTASPNSPGAFKFAAIAGSPSGTPAAVSDSTIQTALGSAVAWERLSDVLRPAGVNNVVDANVSDKRRAVSALVEAAIANGSVTVAKLANGAVTPGKLGAGTLVPLGISPKTTIGTIIPTTYTTYCTVTASTTGGPIHLDYRAKIRDGNSGGARIGEVRVQMDGTTVANTTVFWKTPVTDSHADVSVLLSHTPSAGAHTWTLQVIAGTASASLLDQATLRVEEVKP